MFNANTYVYISYTSKFYERLISNNNNKIFIAFGRIGKVNKEENLDDVKKALRRRLKNVVRF